MYTACKQNAALSKRHGAVYPTMHMFSIDTEHYLPFCHGRYLLESLLILQQHLWGCGSQPYNRKKIVKYNILCFHEFYYNMADFHGH